jgi:peptidoglycan endopeptidase LytE
LPRLTALTVSLGASLISMAVAGTPTAFAASGSKVYVVRAGDTLTAIAERLHTTVARLEALNHLGPQSLLQIGERLVVPGVVPASGAGSRQTYTVQAGDTLSGIAARFGTTPQALATLNHLSLTSLLQVGQRLVVAQRPAPPVSSASAAPRAAVHRYTVQAGDTLSAISARFGVSVTALARANHLSSVSLIRIGQVLVIPGRAQAVPLRPVNLTLGQRIVAEAMRFLGVPYVWGGASPAGFDCSGLVQYVFAQLGISVPRTASGQWSVGSYVPRSQLSPGDVVFFDTLGGVSHVGIYIGDGRFIDAPDVGDTVQISNLNDAYWSSRYIGARWLGNL